MVEVFDRHGVEYLVVGGHAAIAYGAKRTPRDVDCLVRTSRDSVDRVAAAQRERRARLRVSGPSTEESASLPVQIDVILRQSEFSNWRTDAGDLDVMTALWDRSGAIRRNQDLIDDACVLEDPGIQIRVASLDAIVAAKAPAGCLKHREALPELHRLPAYAKGCVRRLSDGPVSSLVVELARAWCPPQAMGMCSRPRHR